MLLKVPSAELEQYGAVSAQTACSMAQGLQALSGADVNVSITGIAGPDGGTEQKPVGLIFVGLAINKSVVAFRFQFEGDRDAIRTQTVDKVLLLLTEAVKGDNFFEED
ncbi:Nicotinamide-nucleotide amidohydrolase PncC [bioreactor metagenome]|uniref:Nicotinamide-nucleotide amidohydrolase PncC n=1 Tax=bioreactor metagenome TaxID=1076179 RepID=A0A645JPP2_9ZZZZ